jgi:hypothetical protein
MFCKIVQNEIPLFDLRKTTRNTNLEEHQFAAYHFIDSEYQFGEEILLNLFSVYNFIASEYHFAKYKSVRSPPLRSIVFLCYKHHFAKEILLNLIRCSISKEIE